MNGRSSMDDSHRRGQPKKPNFFTRCCCAVLAVSGVVYVGSIVFLVFWPGVFIWCGWISIALGWSQLNKIWFWVFSFSWNFFALLFFGSALGGPELNNLHLVIQCGLAMLFSILAIRQSSRQMVQREKMEQTKAVRK